MWPYNLISTVGQVQDWWEIETHIQKGLSQANKKYGLPIYGRKSVRILPWGEDGRVDLIDSWPFG